MCKFDFSVLLVAMTLMTGSISAQAQTLPLDELLAQSSELLLKDQSQEALELLKAHENTYSSSREYMNNLAIAYLGTDKPKFAFAILRQLINQDPACNIIAHNLLEMELEIAGAGTDKITPALFLQSIDSYQDSTSTPEPQVANDNTPEIQIPASQPVEIRPPEVKTLDTQTAAVTTNAESPALTPADNNADSRTEPGTESNSVDGSASPSVEQVLFDWARAWSNRDFENYIDHYSLNFISAGGARYSAWRDYRRERLDASGDIQIQVSDIEVEFLEPDLARAQFDQSYSSQTLTDRVAKEVLLELGNDKRWKFISEKTLKAY